jgi:SNF2 family DNA or RNA helicase
MPAIEKSKRLIGPDTFLIKLECGHSNIVKINRAQYDFISERGTTPFPFQKDGIRFIEDTGFRCLIGDEMGLGKTVQMLGALRLHPEMLPVLKIVKSGLKRQLELETYNWNGGDPMIQTIESLKGKGLSIPLEYH